MFNYNKIIGFPVFDIEAGKKIGIIEEILFDVENIKVGSFIFINYAKKRFLLTYKDATIKHDSIIVKNLIKGKRFKKKDNTYFEGKSLLKKAIYDTKGEQLGSVTDVLIDEESGIIDGFRISDGIIEDIVNGRKIIPLLDRFEIKEEGVFVGKTSVEEVIDSEKGIKKIFSR